MHKLNSANSNFKSEGIKRQTVCFNFLASMYRNNICTSFTFFSSVTNQTISHIYLSFTTIVDMVQTCAVYYPRNNLYIWLVKMLKNELLYIRSKSITSRTLRENIMFGAEKQCVALQYIFSRIKQYKNGPNWPNRLCLILKNNTIIIIKPQKYKRNSSSL